MIHYIEMTKKRRLESVELFYHAEVKQAEEEFLEEKTRIFDEMLNDLKDKRRRLDLKGTSMSTRKKAQQQEKNKSKSNTSAKALKVSLSEEEIESDLKAMSRPFIAWNPTVNNTTVKVVSDDAIIVFEDKFQIGMIVLVEYKQEQEQEQEQEEEQEQELYTVKFRGVISEITPFDLFIKRDEDNIEVRIKVQQIRDRFWRLSIVNNDLIKQEPQT